MSGAHLTADVRNGSKAVAGTDHGQGPSGAYLNDKRAISIAWLNATNRFFPVGTPVTTNMRELVAPMLTPASQ